MSITTRYRRGPQPVDLKPCKHCGETMERKVKDSGALESPSHYKRRKYCSDECAKVGIVISHSKLQRIAGMLDHQSEVNKRLMAWR